MNDSTSLPLFPVHTETSWVLQCHHFQVLYSTQTYSLEELEFLMLKNAIYWGIYCIPRFMIGIYRLENK